MIEGHGGVLDRVDLASFASPLFFYLTRYYFLAYRADTAYGPPSLTRGRSTFGLRLGHSGRDQAQAICNNTLTTVSSMGHD
jgi:hypothetical protein